MYGVDYTEINRHGGSIGRVELKQRYLSLIKRYHSDNCQHDERMMREYEQITKIIIKSYNQLEKIAVDVRKDTKKEELSVEDRICLELFGKRYDDAKYWIHQVGNEKQKKQFFQRLFMETGNVNYRQKSSSTVFNTNKQERVFHEQKKNIETDHQNIVKILGIGIFGLAVLLGIFSWYLSMKQQSLVLQPNKQKQFRQLFSTQKVDTLIKKTYEQKQKKANAMITLIQKDHPPSLKYPSQDPHILRQLTQYSIGPDIHLYEVDPRYYYELREKVMMMGLDIKNIFEIKRVRANTAMTLSLEAERALHNVYVKVSDVIDEIRKKGKYTPPQVFIKFHGFVMVKIREKPMTLSCYRDTDYISLFELYFDYFSPIFMKRDNYCNYLVGKDEKQYFGWVHLNRNKCNPIYVKAGQRAVFFHSQKSAEMIKMEREIWKSYYEKYEDRWREGGNTRERVGT